MPGPRCGSQLANRGAPVGQLVFLVGVLVAHDAVLLPLANGVGALIGRLVPASAQVAVRMAACVSVVVALIATPFVLGYGRTADEPSALPLDYSRGLAVTLGAVWASAAIAVLTRHVRRARPPPAPRRLTPCLEDAQRADQARQQRPLTLASPLLRYEQVTWRLSQTLGWVPQPNVWQGPVFRWSGPPAGCATAVRAGGPEVTQRRRVGGTWGEGAGRYRRSRRRNRAQPATNKAADRASGTAIAAGGTPWASMLRCRYQYHGVM